MAQKLQTLGWEILLFHEASKEVTSSYLACWIGWLDGPACLNHIPNTLGAIVRAKINWKNCPVSFTWPFQQSFNSGLLNFLYGVLRLPKRRLTHLTPSPARQCVMKSRFLSSISGPSTGDASQCNKVSVVLLDLITCEIKNNKKVICHSYTAPSQTHTWTWYTMAIQRPNNCYGYAHSEMGEKAITKHTIDMF